MSDVCNVLVVEDHDAVRAVLGDVVALEGYRFTGVRTAAEARKAVAADHFDVAIVDVTLPGEEDGLALADYLAGLGIGTIVTSGDPKQDDRIARTRHTTLAKPFRLAELKDCIRHVLEKIDADCTPSSIKS
jgi:DNA-binding NtrC family response regulator